MTPADLVDLINHRCKAIGLDPKSLASRTGYHPFRIQRWLKGESLDHHCQFLVFLEHLGIRLTVRPLPNMTVVRTDHPNKK